VKENGANTFIRNNILTKKEHCLLSGVALSLSFEKERKVKNFPFLSFLTVKESEITTPDWFIFILGKFFSVRNYFLLFFFAFF
jgi:hypothetical protein